MTDTCDPNEDHEKFAGPIIPDPWDDPEQTDWPMNPEVKNDGSGVGSDAGDATPA